ncbi:hypothetical protein U1701_11060 [Sphingomonas sp. PB2P19]|uniref:hypothetical protein n=1 Tax=Sphingomonas rhamnosi TaxID=3096156 RepID=UPI002FC8CC79
MNKTLPLTDRASAFRLQRLSLMDGSFATAIDADVDRQLARLDDLLGKRVIRIEADEKDDEEGSGNGADTAIAVGDGTTIDRLLARPLLPWRPKAEVLQQGWPKDSLADFLAKAKDDPARITLSDYVDDQDPELAEVKYDVQDQLTASRWRLGPNTRAVIDGRDHIRDYLIARAWHVARIRDAESMVHYLLTNRAGVKAVIDYATVSAARAIVEARRLKVPDYHEDGKAFSERIKAKAPSFAKAAFAGAVDEIARDLMYNAEAGKLIDDANLGVIPPHIRLKLVSLIQTSPVPITASNAKYFLPHFISLAYDQEPALVAEPVEAPGEDRGWRVQFQDSIDQEVDVDRDAVRYAAQLFHGMVLGDELQLFDAVDYLIHSRMVVGGGMSAADRAVRADLKLYALSNKFRDLAAPGQPIEDRTRASERTMFARAVFDQGDGELMEGMERNAEFRSLWQVLMLEAARYLDRAQESYNPDSFVSKQNVMQAVEDLQYNLSTYCIGWPQVVAPVVDAEINFVLTRFMRNPAVARQILPAGGSWKRIVDKLNAERPKDAKKRAPRAAALLYAKARQGMAIIEAVADYDPAAFEDDRSFSAFISLVDGYITTESKLAPRRRGRGSDEDIPDEGHDDRPPPRSGHESGATYDEGDGAHGDHDSATAAGGWDF